MEGELQKQITLILHPEGTKGLYRVFMALHNGSLSDVYQPEGTLIATLDVASLTEKPRSDEGHFQPQSTVHGEMAEKTAESLKDGNFD